MLLRVLLVSLSLCGEKWTMWCVCVCLSVCVCACACVCAHLMLARKVVVSWWFSGKLGAGEPSYRTHRDRHKHTHTHTTQCTACSETYQTTCISIMYSTMVSVQHTHTVDLLRGRGYICIKLWTED